MIRFRSIAALAAAVGGIAACNSAVEGGVEAEAGDMQEKELIVLAAPRSDDSYYEAAVDEIFEFHVAYAKAIMARDDVLILTDMFGRTPANPAGSGARKGGAMVPQPRLRVNPIRNVE